MSTVDIEQKEDYILFELDKTTYGIPSRQIAQIDMLSQFTKVPNAPDFVAGVVFLRGDVVPAINLRHRFGLPDLDVTMKSRLVVINYNNRKVGLIVDTAREFIPIAPKNIQPPSEELSGISGEYLAGIAILAKNGENDDTKKINHENSRLIFILNLEHILNRINTTNLV